MRTSRISLYAVVLALLAAAPAQGAHPEPAHSSATAPTQGSDARYAIVNGGYALRSQALGRRLPNGPFPLQATELGPYLLYGPARNFLTASGGGVTMAGQSSAAAEWDVHVVDGAFRLSSRAAGRPLAVNRSNGALVLGGSGPASLFQLEETAGCAVYPEVEVNATGPSRGSTPYTETSGLLDAHMHLTAYEYLGEFTRLIGTNAEPHRAVGPGRARIGRGTRVRRLRGVARRVRRGLYVRRARGGVRFVYGVRRGRVRYVAVASRSVGSSGRRLRAYIRLAGLR